MVVLLMVTIHEEERKGRRHRLHNIPAGGGTPCRLLYTATDPLSRSGDFLDIVGPYVQSFLFLLSKGLCCMKAADNKKFSVVNRTRWGQVLLFLGAGIVASFQVGKVPPVLPAIRGELGMSLFGAGWILSSFSIIGLFLGSMIGAVSDSFGHHRMLLLGLAGQAMGSLIGGFASVPALLLATRTLEGLGCFMVAVAAPSLIMQMTQPKDLRLTLSIWSCWMPAGTAMIMLLTPVIMSLSGWRGLWLLNAAILAGYALVSLWRSEPLATPPHKPRVSLIRLWNDIFVAAASLGPSLLAITFSTYTLLWMAVMGFLPTFLIEDYGITAGKAAILTGIIVSINVPGNLVGGWLLYKGYRRVRLIIVASVVMGLCSVAIYSAAITFSVRYLACLLFSGVGGIMPAALLSAVPVHAPRAELVATTNGLLIQGSQLGQVVGPPALALIVSRLGGWQAAPILLVSTAALGIVLSLGLAALERAKSFSDAVGYG
jgi:MFS family permease